MAIDKATARRLELPMMYESNQDKRKTAFTVTVDLAEGITTGVSAVERTATINALSNPNTKAADLVRPGHIFPLIAHEDGLAARGGHTEAGIALAQLVGAKPAALLSEIVNDDGSMARGQSLRDFAAEHQIMTITIDELTEYWRENFRQSNSHVELNWCTVQLPEGAWDLATYPALKARDHVIARFGSEGKAPLIRVHSECFTGDVLSSLRCDCGEQLALSKKLIEKLKAYQLQDQGLDTVEANEKLGLPIDARDWSDVIEILRSLHVSDLTLLTNNPEKVKALTSAGFIVTQRNLAAEIHEFNRRYIETKRAKLGHERGNA